MKRTLIPTAALVVVAAFLASALAGPQRRFEPVGIGGGGGLFSPIGSPHDPGLCFVSCDMGGFYVSEDGGETWWMVNRFEMSGSTTCRPAFHPTKPDVVYMPYGRKKAQIRISTDRGRHWEVLCADGGWGKERVHAIITDPGGTGKVLLVCTTAGLFRSGDGGRNFSKCPGLDDYVLWAHFDQTTSKRNRRCIAGATGGVYLSKNAGKTWAKKGAGLTGDITGFCAGSNSRTKRVVCYATTGEGVFVSVDGGETFEQAATLPAGEYRFACMAASHPRTCYVTSTRWRVYKTTDGGRTWQNVFRFQKGSDRNVEWGWLATDVTPGWGGSAIGFGVNPADPDHAMFTNTGELFVTRDGGRNWTQAMSKHLGRGSPRPGDRWASIGLEVTTVWDYQFDPFDRNRTYICYTDIGFARSTDRGRSWYWGARGSPWGNTFYNMVFDPTRKGVLYAAAANHHDIPSWANCTGPKGPGGVVMSTDHAETWKSISNGLPTEDFPCTCVALDPDSPPDRRTLYAVMHGDGVYKTTDGGRSWNRKSKGLGRPGNMNVYLVRIGPDKTLYSLVTANRRGTDFDVPGGLWTSTDGGESWTELTRGIELWWPTEFAVHPEKPDRIWICASDVPGKSGGGLFVTTNGGRTWKHQLTQRFFDPEVLSYCHLFAIRFHPENPDIMYLSVWTHGLFRSADGGKTWKRLEGLPCETSINRVAFDPKDPDVIYVTTFGSGVWKGPANGY